MKHDLGNTGLTFLLSIAAMPLACAADDGDDTHATTVSSTAPSTTSPGTTDPGTGTTDDPPTSASTTASTTDPDDGSTGEVPDACQTYAQHYAVCFPDDDADMAAQYCASYLGYGADYGAGCIAAIEDTYACLATVDCAAWENERTPICEAQYAAVMAACPWEEDTSGSDDGTSEGGSDDGESSG